MNKQKITNFITKHQLITPGSTVILGLSGGPDSVFLLHFLAAWHKEGIIHLIAAHLDHGWRDESYQDMVFCKELCTQLGIPFVTAHACEFQIPQKGSKEEIGRILRRLFFEQVAQKNNARIIALAHHKDDQLETFFLRLIRGSSIAGLTGIKPKQGLYVRPLLEVSKAEIVSYLAANQHVYMKDQTNDSLDFLRNRIRHIIIPAFKRTDERSYQTLMQTIKSLQETDDFLAQHTKQLFDSIATIKNDMKALQLSLFKNLHPAMQKNIVLYWLCNEQVSFPATNAFLQEIIRFLCTPQGGTHQIQTQWSIIKKSTHAFIVHAKK